MRRNVGYQSNCDREWYPRTSTASQSNLKNMMTYFRNTPKPQLCTCRPRSLEQGSSLNTLRSYSLVTAISSISRNRIHRLIAQHWILQNCTSVTNNPLSLMSLLQVSTSTTSSGRYVRRTQSTASSVKDVLGWS